MEHVREVSLRSTTILALALTVTACAGDQPEEDPSLPPGTPVGLSEEPILVVGERPNDPNHEFYRVVTPFLLPEGALGVPLSSAGVIRVFDRDGRFVRSLGSSGQGPGEFMALDAAWARGDTIEALDNELNRVTRFAPNEDPATVLLEAVASAQSGVPGLENGGWILYGVKEVQRSGRDLIAVHHFAPDGSHVAELGEVRGFRRHVHDAGAGPDPVSPRPVVRTSGNRVYVAETLTPHITVFDVSIGVNRTFEWDPESPLSYDEAVAIAREQVSDSGSSQMNQAWTLASFDALTGDEEISVFWDLLVDGEEFVWVRGYDPSIHAVNVGGLTTTGSGGEWIILDQEGRHVNTVSIPDDVEPLRIDSDHLIGLRRNELDVESVRVYRIERTGS